MVQTGLVGKWHKDEVNNFKMKQNINKGRVESQVYGVNMRQVTVRPLAMDHLQV